MKKKKAKKERKSKKQVTNRDFFQADWNDEVYIQRTIAQKGGVGGRKIG